MNIIIRLIIGIYVDCLLNQSDIRKILETVHPPMLEKNTLVSNGHKITSDTVDNYLQLMCDAHMLYQCERYGIRGKERLKTNGKYYVVDTGLRNKLIGYRHGNFGHVIENIVYLQLLRMDYEVSVGKNMSYEVDFMIKGVG